MVLYNGLGEPMPQAPDGEPVANSPAWWAQQITNDLLEHWIAYRVTDLPDDAPDELKTPRATLLVEIKKNMRAELEAQLLREIVSGADGSPMTTELMGHAYLIAMGAIQSSTLTMFVIFHPQLDWAGAYAKVDVRCAFELPFGCHQRLCPGRREAAILAGLQPREEEELNRGQ